MLPTNFKRLHPKPGAGGKDVLADNVYHAVGLTMDKLELKAPDELVMIDPWPGVDGSAKDRDKISPALEQAHKERGLHALMYYWTGWS